MNIENMLYRYDGIPTEIQKLNAEMNDILHNQYQARNTLKATTITDMPMGGGTSDPTYEAVEKIIDDYGERIQEIVKEINLLLNTKSQLEKALRVLNTDEMQIIDLRYYQRIKMTRIKYKMNYSLQHCYRILENAKEKIAVEITKHVKKC